VLTFEYISYAAAVISCLYTSYYCF